MIYVQGAGIEGGDGEDDLSHLSARERNQLRRKNRKQQRQGREVVEAGGGKTEGKTSVTSQPQDANKVVVESSVVDVGPIDPNEWQLAALCDDLTGDIFDTSWEVRHGAAMGLRDLLRHHAAAAGKWANTSLQQQVDDNLLWLEDCTIRILCVLALDRFGDYVSDPVVAPVRETCAQALGVVLRGLTHESLRHVTRVLHDMQSIPEWEVRHGGMLGLKYLVVVRKESIIQDHLKDVLPLMRAAIESEDDDVRSVGAEALQPLAHHLVTNPECFAWFGKPLLALLWTTLQHLDDLTASTSAVMALMAEMAQHLPSHAAGEIGGGSSEDLGVLMSKLYPFFRHNMTSVRRSVLKIAINLATLCEKAAQVSSSSNLLKASLGQTLHRVFLNVILEQRADILATSHGLWDQLLRVAAGEELANAVASNIKLWLQAVATPPGQALDPKVLGTTTVKSKTREAAERKRAQALASAKGSSVIEGKTEADADVDESLTNLDDMSASVKMRLSGVRAMGALAWRLQCTGGDQMPIVNQIKALMTGALGTHVQVGALLLAEWATAACSGPDAKSSYTLPDSLQAILDQKLDTIGQTNYPYAEIASLSGKWREELAQLLQDFSKGGVKEASAALKGTDIASLNMVHGLELAQKASEWEAQVKTKEKDPKKVAEISKKRSKAVRQVFITIGQLEVVQTSLHTSVIAAVASVLVAAQNLPAKIGPVIRALMDSLQRESNLDLQLRSAKSMVGLLRLCAPRKPCPNGKVINNLSAYLCEDPSFTPQVSLFPSPRRSLFSPYVSASLPSPVFALFR
jgi:TATA-binding protein-associated factor